MTIIKFPTSSVRNGRRSASLKTEASEEDTTPTTTDTVTEIDDSTLDWTPDEQCQYEDGTFAADEETWKAMHAHFARYGLKIHRMAPLDSYLSGLTAISEVLSLVGYLRDHPWHYGIYSKGFTADEHAYIKAVSDNDTAAAAHLAPPTQFAFNIRRAMTVDGGCGLA